MNLECVVQTLKCLIKIHMVVYKFTAWIKKLLMLIIEVPLKQLISLLAVTMQTYSKAL